MTCFSPSTSRNGDLKEILELSLAYQTYTNWCLVLKWSKMKMELYKYQDITLQCYERKKESIWRNTTKYINMILEALTETFGALFEENDHEEDESGTAIAGDAILFYNCWVLESRKWIAPEGMAITLEAMDALLEKNTESLSKIFDHFTQMFKKISPAITIETIIDDYISLVMYAMKNYNRFIYTPLKMWQLLSLFKMEWGWCKTI